MKFYAHSVEKKPKSEWQPLAEHLNAVGKMAGQFADVFGASDMSKIAGQLHDLGKYTQEFQNRLEGGQRVDHSTWGAKVAIERYRDLGQLLAYVIAGHHAGLADGKSGENQQRTNLEDRLNAKLHDLIGTWENDLSLDPSISPPGEFNVRSDRGMFQLSLLTRMVFSCLVDADFIDTDEFYRRVEGRRSRRVGNFPSLAALRERLDKTLNGFTPDSEINRQRANILAHVRGRAMQAPGLFSLTVPTGGGKTLASLAFALDHAIEHGLRRVIYVIPFTSVIEQNAQVFREAFADLGDDAVLEHHSAYVDDASLALEAREKRKLATENWDFPVVVTTSVQFFESFFANRPSRCRKLHNIAGSVVILDEAQTLPLGLLSPCVTLLDELSLNYKNSIVLCTATQPALREEQEFPGGLKDVRELAPNPTQLYEKLRRVRVRHVGTVGDEKIVEQYLTRENQILCIVNNRRHARFLYESIADQPGAYHLTTLMYASHRKEVLSSVKRHLEANEPCKLVATSLIEAGVDVDFPIVLRAEAGLDSVAQAAGRCNREGKRSLESSETLVFSTEESDWTPPPELKQFAQVFRSVHRRHAEDLLALDAVDEYFRELYWQKGRSELDVNDLLISLKGCRPDSLPFETMARNFRFIESVMRPIVIPYFPGTDRMRPDVSEALKDLEFAPSVARILQPYLVQIPQRAYDCLREAGAVVPVAEARFGEQFMELVNPDLYSDTIGLHWDEPAFIRAERLVL